MERMETNRGAEILDSWLARLNRGVLIVISGPSGAGKGTLCRLLLEKEKDIKLSVSATTRLPRAGEVEGTHYFFMKKADFIQQINENAFLEWAQVYDNYYGTPRKQVEEFLSQGKNVLLEIDIQGALQVKKHYQEAALIFIAPPSLEELAKRIYGRGTDSKEVIQKRLRLASEELEYIDKYDYCIINDEVERATERLQAIVAAERSRIYRS
ncbi:guanylate kinase [Heliorestis convoluta]|uniref:Guanylate kinase n=2 Tax=Heliorestis convoluta TaxID=356322 RepID=A0A5Q2N293_9FIRM|nr:guanylate kinase [Heliorestis convoluta]